MPAGSRWRAPLCRLPYRRWPKLPRRGLCVGGLGALRIAGAVNRPGSRDPPHCVHYWTDLATFSRFYRLRQMGTNYSNWQKWEYSMASAQIPALGPFLFCADHLVLKGHAFGIVFRKPRLCGVSIREDLEVIF